MKRNELIGRTSKWMRLAGLAIAAQAFLTAGAFADVSKEPASDKKVAPGKQVPVERKRELRRDVPAIAATIAKPGGKVTFGGQVRPADVLDEKPEEPGAAISEQAIPPEPKNTGGSPPQIFLTHAMLKLYLFWLGVDIDTALELGLLTDARLIQMFLAEFKNVLLRYNHRPPVDSDTDFAAIAMTALARERAADADTDDSDADTKGKDAGSKPSKDSPYVQ
jgi:hypothetical protein